ncbi:MAG: hydrogenase maturation protease [Methanobacteriaceae archaeon]|jgi:hydrogenase maturation protease|nr:hydrogenase maturation protease [Methanobacteriaceae archaeon]
MICVVGFGNLLLGDDGVGIQIIQKLEERDLPNQADIIDAGTYGAILFSLIEKYNKIIIVDAFRSNQDIENIIFMKASHIIKEKEKYYFSGHDLSLFDIFSMMKSVYSEKILDNICILGIRIHKIEESLELSDDVTKSAEMAVNMITNNFLSGDESWMNH